MKTTSIVLFITMLLFVGCGSSRQVSRVAADQQTGSRSNCRGSQYNEKDEGQVHGILNPVDLSFRGPSGCTNRARSPAG